MSLPSPALHICRSPSSVSLYSQDTSSKYFHFSIPTATALLFHLLQDYHHSLITSLRDRVLICYPVCFPSWSLSYLRAGTVSYSSLDTVTSTTELVSLLFSPLFVLLQNFFLYKSVILIFPLVPIIYINPSLSGHNLILYVLIPTILLHLPDAPAEPRCFDSLTMPCSVCPMPLYTPLLCQEQPPHTSAIPLPEKLLLTF